MKNIDYFVIQAGIHSRIALLLTDIDSNTALLASIDLELLTSKAAFETAQVALDVMTEVYAL